MMHARWAGMAAGWGLAGWSLLGFGGSLGGGAAAQTAEEILYHAQFGRWEVTCAKDPMTDEEPYCLTIAHAPGLGPFGPTDLQHIVISNRHADHNLWFHAGFDNPQFVWQQTSVLIKVDDGPVFSLHCIVQGDICFFSPSETDQLAQGFITAQTSVRVRLEDVARQRYDFVYDMTAPGFGKSDFKAVGEAYCAAVRRYIEADGSC